MTIVHTSHWVGMCTEIISRVGLGVMKGSPTPPLSLEHVVMSKVTNDR